VISDFPVREPVLQAPETGGREVAKNAVMCLCIKITARKVVMKIMLSSEITIQVCAHIFFILFLHYALGRNSVNLFVICCCMCHIFGVFECFSHHSMNLTRHIGKVQMYPQIVSMPLMILWQVY